MQIFYIVVAVGKANHGIVQHAGEYLQPLESCRLCICEVLVSPGPMALDKRHIRFPFLSPRDTKKRASSSRLKDHAATGGVNVSGLLRVFRGARQRGADGVWMQARNRLLMLFISLAGSAEQRRID